MKHNETLESTEEQQMDPKELKEALGRAQYAALSRACTEQAKQLVDHVFERVMKANSSSQASISLRSKRSQAGFPSEGEPLQSY